MKHSDQKPIDTFIRLLEMNKPLELSDDIPLREVLPGMWPTIGDLRRLVEEYKETEVTPAIPPRLPGTADEA